ncbi:hypothetical protein SHELI_v1c05280 [Spiroplasma helicoides]|uniref:Uncharacterized protein n=1 Tax=Spiroplasma helicoides TaxID=216938 RepID=A0A1B3SKK4_9MOLU|nr:hypothetical protein [Spiroplasma helicoides]AOG60479.1 hypothetical protein SHELI_v1c05280 [Spiroplasma helicoides]
MLEKFLNKEEKRLFSKKNLKKIRKEDFFAYLEMEESLLQSLKQKYNEDNFENPIVEDEIVRQEQYVKWLNEYYFEYVLVDPNKGKVPNTLEEEFDKLIKPIEKIQKK